MRQRAVLRRGDDRGEARALGAAHAHLLLERERDLALGAPDEPALRHPLVDLVDERRGRADRRDLRRLLDRALRLDQPAGRDQLDPVGQRLAQLGVAAHRDVLVLEAEPQLARRPALGERGAQLLRRRLEVEAVDLAPWRARRSGSRSGSGACPGPTTARPFVPVKPVR